MYRSRSARLTVPPSHDRGPTRRIGHPADPSTPRRASVPATTRELRLLRATLRAPRSRAGVVACAGPGLPGADPTDAWGSPARVGPLRDGPGPLRMPRQQRPSADSVRPGLVGPCAAGYDQATKRAIGNVRSGTCDRERAIGSPQHATTGLEEPDRACCSSCTLMTRRTISKRSHPSATRLISPWTRTFEWAGIARGYW